VVLLALLQGPTPGFAGEATLSWDPNTESDLAGYMIYFGASSGVYGTPIDAGTQTTYTVTGLAIGPYYFAVTAYNTAGTESTFSNEATKIIVDTAPPVMTALSASGITSTGATITWATDEPATSQVEYGTSNTYGTVTATQTTLGTPHEVTLPQLTAGTTYHYRVSSQDAAGNLAVSEDQTFATLSTPSQDSSPPADVLDFTASPGDGEIVLSWRDPGDQDFVGVRIRVRVDGAFPNGPTDGTLVGDFTGQPGQAGGFHHAGLQNGITYSYAAFSYDSSGNYSQIVYASTTPASSQQATLDPSASTAAGGFGCGAIRNTRGPFAPPPPTLDLIALAVVAAWFALKRARMRKRFQIIWKTADRLRSPVPLFLSSLTGRNVIAIFQALTRQIPLLDKNPVSVAETVMNRCIAGKYSASLLNLGAVKSS
jgi:hypothetical protein